MAAHCGSGTESAALVAEDGVETEGAGGPTEEQRLRAVRVRAVALGSSLLALASVAFVCWWRSATAASVAASSRLEGDFVQEASSSFDGCWQARSYPAEAQAIKDGKVYWEGGATTDVSVSRAALYMTLHGNTYTATLTGGDMQWSDGDVWERVDDSYCGDSKKDPVDQGPDFRDLEVHRLLNEARMEGFKCSDGTKGPKKKRKLRFDCRIWKASKLHAMDMDKRGFFDHVNPEGEDSDDRAKKQGYKDNTRENIQYGAMTAQDAIAGWMSSLGHCKNMQKDGYMHATAFEAYLSVMNMGDKKVDPDRSCLPEDSDVY